MQNALVPQAKEIVRLANMALADCGLPGSLFVDSSGVPAWNDNVNGMSYRAALLAARHVGRGIGDVRCPAHTDSRECAFVTPTEALMGRTCWKAQP